MFKSSIADSIITQSGELEQPNSVSDLWPFLDRFIQTNLQLGDC
ncbi:hypothetical protein NC651_025963 [Populus alba x Populus x berolinensis]|nr:hypothetical protein NC651_025963 [Populus alba x Populus x berolinensis]